MFQDRQSAQMTMELFVGSDFERLPTSVRIEDRVFLSYLKQGEKTKRKKFVTDFDGVFEAEGTLPLYRLFFIHLAEENRKVEGDNGIVLNEIDAFIQTLYEGVSYKDVFSNIRNYLKKKNLQKYQYDEACRLAAEEWKPSEEALQTVKEMNEMGYSFTVISGSSQDALVKAAAKVGFGEYEVIGTKYEFDSLGRLVEIYPMLGDSKLKIKREIVGRKLKTKREIVGKWHHVSVTDDMQTDYFLTYGADFSIVIADRDEKILRTEKELLTQLYVYDKSIRRNFSYLLNYMMKFEYGFLRLVLTTEATERNIVRFAQETKNAKTKQEFLDNLINLRRELGIFDPFVGLEEMAAIEAYAQKDDIEGTETGKKLKEHIFSALKRVPEFNNLEAFAKVWGKNEGN
jgi:phosphoserine phosphatase